jgi:hypothetical protein
MLVLNFSFRKYIASVIRTSFSFHIFSNLHIICIVQFDLRAASLNKPRDKDFYSFGTHNKVPPCIAMLYIPWVMGPEAEKGLDVVSLFHRAFQFTMCNGPTNALVCNKTLIQMSHIKTLKITLTCFDHQMIIITELFDPG